MKQKLHFFRPAIAMIELIFAIVVMGIVIMSAPMLLSVASNSGTVAIQQESISEAATQLSIIMGYEWDENNTVDGHTPVLNTNGTAALNGVTGLSAPLDSKKRRRGTPLLSKRHFKSYDGSEFNATAVALLGSDTGELINDDIDDFSGTTSLIVMEAVTNNSDYIEKTTVSIDRTITYMQDDTVTSSGTYTNPGTDNQLDFTPFADTNNTTSNIKHIQVTLTSTSTSEELNKTIVLHAFSSNIGSYELEERL